MTQSLSAAYNAGAVRSLVNSHSNHFRDIVSKFRDNYAVFGNPDKPLETQLAELDAALVILNSAVEEDIANLN